MKPLLGFFGLLLILSTSASAGDVEVRGAWIREPPPESNAAGYLTLRNRGDRPRRVVRVESDGAERVEMHRSVIEDGMARMIPVAAIEVPPGGEVELAPRGLHLMLIHPRPLRGGDELELRLELDRGEFLEVQAVVR